MAAIYDALGNVIGDDGQPSIDQMQYELARNGKPSPLDSAVNAIKNVAINNNPLMLRKQGIDLAGDVPRVVASGVAPYIAGITQPVVGAYQYASKMPGVLYRENVLGDPQSMQEAATIREGLPQFAPPGARYNPAPMNQRIEAIGQAVAPQTPQGQAVLEGATQVFEPLKLPMIGPGSGLPGTSRVSPRPLITPNDVRVLGAEATRVGKQVVDIPTDFVNAQSGFQRIDPVTNQPVMGARIQSGVDRLGDIMEQRKMQGLTPIPGLPAVFQPETNMYAIRPQGSRLTTPTLPETAKEYVPDVDPVGQMLREINIDPNVSKPTPTMLDEIVNDQIKKSDSSNTAMSAFRYFQEDKALEMFPDAPSGSDALMALKVSLYDDNARTAKINELYDQFIQTPEGQEYLPNAASTSELAERHEAAVEGLKNMWGKYLIKNLGTEGNPLVKMAAQEGLAYLPDEEVIDNAQSQRSHARSFRRNAGMPVEGSFATDISALQQEIEALNLPIKNAANAERSLNDQLLIAKKMAEQDPTMEPQAREIGNLHKEAKKNANKLVKQKTEIQKKLDRLTLADAYETLEDASVAPIDASTMLSSKLPYAVQQFYPELKESAKRGEMAYMAYPSPMKETGIIDAAKQFYDDVLANRIPKEKAPTYPVDRYIHGIAKERAQNIQKYRTDVFNDMKSVASAIPEDKRFSGNVGVIELTQDTPKFVANKEAALSTEALDICIGEGGGGSGTRNFFTKKKDPRWTPIVDILTGKPNPNASSHASPYVDGLERGEQLPMFRDLETGMPIAALQFHVASSVNANGQPKFNIGYASGARNGPIDPKYADGIRDYLNTRADDIAGIGDKLEDNTGIYDTTNKSSLRKSRTQAQVTEDQMKTVDWNSMPRFMTAKDIKQAVQGNVPAVVQQQSSAFNPADVAELKATLVDNIEFVVDEAMFNSGLPEPDRLERRLDATFSRMRRNFFGTFIDEPIPTMNRALDYLRSQIDSHTNSASEISQEMVTALSNYANELQTARDDMSSQQQRAQQPAPQTNALTPQRILQQLDVAWDTMSQNAEAISSHRDRLNRTLERYFIELRNRHYLRDPVQFEMDPEMHLTGAIDDLAEQVAASTNAGTDFGIELANALDSYRDDLNNLLNRYRDQQLAVQMQPPAPQAQMQQAEQLLQQIERPLRSTNDGIVNDALQDYSRNLQRYISNQLQNGMSPMQTATGVRDTINTLRNLVLSQPTDFTRNFTPDQLGDYVSALRQTIDGIGQWIETQNQQAAAPQRANLPAEVQQNIDQRNQDISNAYLNVLIPNTNIAIIDQNLSEFADLLHSMSTNLFGAGFNTAEIVERLQARIRAEIMVLSDPDRVINRGLNVAEADTIRSRLNTAYGDLNEVREAYQVPNRQNQGIGDFEPDNMHGANQPQQYTNTDTRAMARDVFEQERTDANNFDIPSIEQSIYALREGLFDDDRIRRLPENLRQSFANEVALRLQIMLDDINARNRRPDRNLIAEPGRASEALDNALANIENDYGGAVAADALRVRQDISEHVNPGDELSEYVYQLRRNRPGMSEDLRQALDHLADELESVGREAPQYTFNNLFNENTPTTPVPAQPATAPYAPIPANIAAMSDQAITADMTPEERNRVQVIFEMLTDVNSPDELQNIVGLVRSHVMQIWQAISDVQREWLARNIEEYIRDNTTPNTPPATELEQHWRNNVFNGDLTERQALTSLNNVANNTNLSVEDLEVLRSIVNDPDSPQFRVADDDTLRQYNDVIDQAISQREPPQRRGPFRPGGASAVRGVPLGNLNIQPSITAEAFKGPDRQPLSNFLQQVKSMPGVTQEGLKTGLMAFENMDPSQQMTKAEFARELLPSSYDIVDLANSSRRNVHDLEYLDDHLDDDDVLDQFKEAHNIPANLRDDIATYTEYDEFSGALQKYLAKKGIRNEEEFNDAIAAVRKEMVDAQYEDYLAENYPEEDNSPNLDPYQYRTTQRLVEDDASTQYMEFGVAHPDQTKSYTHYPEAPEGVIGHIRGSYNLHKPDILKSNGKGFVGKPNSFVIEEIQSDAQKGSAQKAHLHQVHGVLFKAAIQKALESGANTVYLPTAETIASVRRERTGWEERLDDQGLPVEVPTFGEIKTNRFAPIYDQAVVKEGLKPLLKIPGVTSKMVNGYHEISFTPEAKEHILNGLGQTIPGYRDGGSVKGDAAFGVYPGMGKRSQKSDIGDKLNASLIPQDAFDLATTIAPFGKVGKVLAAGILAGDPAEAHAGNMSSLLKLVAREAPEQFQSIRNALYRTFHTGLEHSVVGSTHMGGPSEVIQGTISSAVPNKLDIRAARRNIDQSPLIDFHTHPSQNQAVSEFKVRPSDTDLRFWMNQYGSSYMPKWPNEARVMVGTPANKGERTTGAYNFFATDKPAQTLNPAAYEAAKYELQRSKPLQTLKDNPLVGEYLDTGGDLGDLMDSASPLLLQKYFAEKGLGRHEMQLSNRPVTSPSVTEQELFNQIANPAMEVLGSKRFESFAKGGTVHKKPSVEQMKYELMMRRA